MAKKGTFTKNDPRINRKGKKVGVRDFSTDFDIAVAEIAEEEGITKSEARVALLKVAYKQSKAANFRFFKDVHDRVYGKAIERTEITGKDGKDLFEPTEEIKKLANDLLIQQKNSRGD